MRYSGAHGIKTRYLRTTFTAWFANEEIGETEPLRGCASIPAPVDFELTAKQQRFKGDRRLWLSSLCSKNAQEAAKIKRATIEILANVEDMILIPTTEREEVSWKLYAWFSRYQFETIC